MRSTCLNLAEGTRVGGGRLAPHAYRRHRNWTAVGGTLRVHFSSKSKPKATYQGAPPRPPRFSPTDTRLATVSGGTDQVSRSSWFCPVEATMPSSGSSQAAGQPNFEFKVNDSLSEWNIPAKDWLVRHAKPYSGLASGNVVFNGDGKVLVIQRASTDSMPNKWELPGGAVSDEDPTFFHGAARELWEESGLKAMRFTQVVTEGPDREPGQVYPNSTQTKIWCRFSFIVEVESCEDVKLDPSEHQNFAWATEDEIRDQKIGDSEHPLTNQGIVSLILEAFRLRREKASCPSI